VVKEKYTAGEIRDLISTIIAELAAQKIGVEKIVLFGSYARGTPRPHSDIDIAVISPAFHGKKMLERQATLARVLKRHLAVVEPVGYPPESFDCAEPGSLIWEIKTKGKLLYAA